MRSRGAALLVAVMLVGTLLAGAAPLDPKNFDPGKAFKKGCMKCHAVPDPAIRTDRAFIDQLSRTT